MGKADIQTAEAVMLVRPAAFGYNQQTADSNAFQEVPDTQSPVAQKALREFDDFVARLSAEDIATLVVDDQKPPAKPDAVFCNNWISFHQDGTAILYPMMAPNRRIERRKDVIEKIKAAGFRITRVIDLSGYEDKDVYLESTGSMVIDYANRVIYACLSPRTSRELLSVVAKELSMDLEVFTAIDRDAQDIYHTNVLMTIADRYAVICDEAIADAGERESVIARLERTGHEIISLTYEQLYAFAGNMLQVKNKSGEKIILMSETAYRSLDSEQVQTIEKYNRIVTAAIPTIETYGGGSVRCMLANIHLPGL